MTIYYWHTNTPSLTLPTRGSKGMSLYSSCFFALLVSRPLRSLCFRSWSLSLSLWWSLRERSVFLLRERLRLCRLRSLECERLWERSLLLDRLWERRFLKVWRKCFKLNLISLSSMKSCSWDNSTFIQLEIPVYSHNNHTHHHIIYLDEGISIRVIKKINNQNFAMNIKYLLPAKKLKRRIYKGNFWKTVFY